MANQTNRENSDGYAASVGAWEVNPQGWLAAIVDSSDDAIIGKTLDSVIRSWNRGAARIFGYSADEIVGRSITTLIPPELQFEESQIVSRLVRGERVEHFESVRLRKDGSRIDVSMSVSPILDPSGKVVGATQVARDVTEARRLREAERELLEQLQNLTAELEQQVEEGQSLQEELEESLDAAEAAQKRADEARREADEARQAAEEANSAKSQFLATMSHELRTPLNAIAGYVDLLEMEVRGPISDSQREDLARIRRSGQTLRRLIDDVLNFAKLESGRLEFHYEEIDLGQFLGTLEGFIAPRVLQKGLEYRFDAADADVTVTTDRDKLEQIILNLLANAVKFTNSGAITLGCRLTDDSVAIDVTDSGPGIKPDAQNSIFEPFVQGDRSLTRTSEGTGLGLAISRQLARKMGGDVTVESTDGQGSTFTLVLPRSAKPPITP